MEVPNVIVKPPVLTPTAVSIQSEADQVLFTVGNSTLRMGYADALKISQWLRVRAKEAKKFAGDQSRHWSVLAVLDGIKV